MSFNIDRNFIDKLSQRLKDPLPGKEAQYVMAASHRGKKDFLLKFEEIPRESSVLILLFKKDDNLFFPLIQRPRYNGVHGGQIGLPGGKVEEGDKDRIATALRETQEEIGVDVSHAEVIGILSELHVQASNFNVLPVVAYIDFEPWYVPEPEEVSHVIEGRVSDLLDDHKRKEKELIVRNNYKIQAPYFDINHEMVWGATAMILNEFTTIIREIK